MTRQELIDGLEDLAKTLEHADCDDSARLIREAIEIIRGEGK